MSNYTCPVNPNHDGWVIQQTDAESPHRGKVVCAECSEHIKWASKKDIARADELEAESKNALICPIMSSLIIGDNVFEGSLVKAECLEDGCAWWTKIDNACAVTSIAFSLLESKVGG